MHHYKKSILSILIFISCNLIHAQESKKIFQYASINSLMEGYYDGRITLSELKNHGNFGIGTYNTLDGEMIFVDNVFYRSQLDGSLKIVDDTTKTPYAVVTNFQSDRVLEIDKDFDYNQFSNFLDSLLNNKNIFYAVRFEGKFEYVKLRTVPKQTKPYQKLVEIVKNQPVFELNNAISVMVGYRSPDFSKGFSVPKYHFHLISKEKNKGGHVLNFSGFKGKVYIEIIDDFELKIPIDEDFSKLRLGDEQNSDVKKVQR